MIFRCKWCFQTNQEVAEGFESFKKKDKFQGLDTSMTELQKAVYEEEQGKSQVRLISKFYFIWFLVSLDPFSNCGLQQKKT